MFHKNSKSISSYKFQINKTKLTIPSIYQNDKLYDFDNTVWGCYYYCFLFLEGLLVSLSKKAIRVFRLQYKNKKRKFFYFFQIFKQLEKNKKRKILLFLFFQAILKKRRKVTLVFLKKKKKFYFKRWRVAKTTTIFYNSLHGKLNLFFNVQQQFFCFIPLNLFFRQGFRQKFRCFKKKMKTKLFIKNSKIIFLKFFLLKNYFERFFFNRFNIKFYFFDSNNAMKQFFLYQKNISAIYRTKLFGRKNTRDFIFKKLLLVSNAAYFFNDASILVRQLSERLTKIRKHKFALRQYFKALYATLPINPAILGINITLYGKLNGKRRTKKATVLFGKVKVVQTLSNNVTYSSINVPSYTGIFGLHLCFVY
jgi:hypothetical protein